MEGLFNHVEQPYNQLNRRLGFLQEHLRRKHSEERLEQIRHEAACIAFELLKREEETRLGDGEAA